MSSSQLHSTNAFHREQEVLELAMGASMGRIGKAIPGRVVPVSTLLGNVCRVFNCGFTLGADQVPASYVMAPSGMLSCVAWCARETAQRLLGVDIGCTLRRDESALFGLRATVPPVTGNLADIVRGLVFLHSARSLFGLRQDGVIDVTQVLRMYEGEFKQILSRAEFNESGEAAWPQAFRPH